MKRRWIKIVVPVLIILIVITGIIVIIKRNVIEKTKNVMFYLESKYYGTGIFNEIKSDELTDLIESEESFAIFIHQPMCSASYEFNKILVQFAEENKISFYKITFDEMKQTKMYDDVKYYPSFAIYNEGELIDFLDAESDEDLNRYKYKDEFGKWFNGYIQNMEK